jgi:hypothetical protein
MTLDLPREPRRYRAEMPEIAWRRGAPPRNRSRRKQATIELAEGLNRYLRRPGIEGDVRQWTVWALELGATGYPTPAPDGSHWFVRVVHE